MGWRQVQGGEDFVYLELLHFIVQQKHNTVKQLYSNKKGLKKNYYRYIDSETEV